jgi:subtilisin family serine protease
LGNGILKVLLGFVLVLTISCPQSLFANESTMHEKWNSSIQSIKEKQSSDMPKQSVNTSNIENSYEKLTNLPHKNKQSIGLTHGVESLDSFRRQYKKKDIFQIQSTDVVDLEKVNDRRILLRLSDSGNFNADDYNVKSVEISQTLANQSYFLIKVPKELDYNDVLQEIRKDSVVVNAEPDYLRSSTFIPSDPESDRQWYLNQIDMTRAWDVNQGSSDVTVAVLDTGVNASHSDLKGRILPGYDFVNNDSNPTDDNGHGTHIAGIVAANSNQIGVTGIDLNAKILPVKIMNKYGQGSTADIVDGIYYAINQGVDVISMSYGSYYRSSAEEEALWYAYNQGITLVAAAGNESTSEWSYPASYVPVIGVAASDKDDRISYFSNYGSWIDITAPGVDIFSTSYLGDYEGGDGTSYSAPIISGLAALLKAQNPEWGPSEIEWALESGAETWDGAEWNAYDGFGRVDAYNALTSSLPSLKDVPDIRNQATALQDEEIYSETINLPMDVDWFKFDVNQSSTITINLSNVGQHLDLVGVLFKMDGDTVLSQHAIDEVSMGGDEQYTVQVEPGNFFLAVFDYFNHWSTNSYGVNVLVDSTPVDDSNLFIEEEPNDSIASANEIPFGMIGGGYFQSYQDFDVYKIVLPYSGDIVITAAADRYAYNNDPVALLQDSGGNFIDPVGIFGTYDESLKYLFETFENISSGTHYIIMGNARSYSDLDNPYLFDISYVGDVTGEVPVPEASVQSGVYHEPFIVELTNQDNSQIKYTLDGSTPNTTNGQLYQGPIEINKDTTLKAVAIKDGVLSSVVTYEYTVELVTLGPPQSNYPSGEYEDSIEVKLSVNDENASILYTIDGSTPTISHGTLYQAPIIIDESTELKAIAIKDRVISKVVNFNYQINSEGYTTFPDATGHWAEDEINFLSQQNLVGGYPNGYFGVSDDIKRSEAAVIIVRELELPLQNADFSDVPDSHWASEYIGAAADKGIITGDGDGTFRPNSYLSRQEMAAILVRSYNLEGNSSISFSDVSIGSWSYEYIEKLVANKITIGYPDHTFRPKSNITRAEFAVMVARVLEESFR